MLFDNYIDDTTLKLEFTLEVEVEDSNQNVALEPHAEASKANTSKRRAVDDIEYLSKKSKNILKGMKAFELHTILQDDPISFCQEVGLLSKSITCLCGVPMRLEYVKFPRGRKHMWMCRKKGHFKNLSVKTGSLFEALRVDIADVLFIIYMWLYRYTVTQMMHECDNSPKMIIDWNNRCVRMCQQILELKNDPIGGEGKIVEVFDCKITETDSKKSCKNWGFCALERDSTNSLMLVVEDHSSHCIREIFGKYFLPGTTVIGLFWSVFKKLRMTDYNYLTEEKEICFFHTTTKTKMDTYKKFVEGVNRHQPLSHLVKYEYNPSFFVKMYRKSLSNAPDAYIQFLEDIATVCPPLKVYAKSEPKLKNERVEHFENTGEQNSRGGGTQGTFP